MRVPTDFPPQEHNPHPRTTRDDCHPDPTPRGRASCPLRQRQPPPQGHRQHPGRPEIDPRRQTRRRPDLRHPEEPFRTYRRGHPPLGEERTRSSCASPRPTPPGPTRSRPAAAVHPGQRGPPQPPRANPGPAPIPVLAQHRCPPHPDASLQPSAVNAPASVAKRASTGAGAPLTPAV